MMTLVHDDIRKKEQNLVTVTVAPSVGVASASHSSPLVLLMSMRSLTSRSVAKTAERILDEANMLSDIGIDAINQRLCVIFYVRCLLPAEEGIVLDMDTVGAGEEGSSPQFLSKAKKETVVQRSSIVVPPSMAMSLVSEVLQGDVVAVEAVVLADWQDIQRTEGLDTIEQSNRRRAEWLRQRRASRSLHATESGSVSHRKRQRQEAVPSVAMHTAATPNQKQPSASSFLSPGIGNSITSSSSWRTPPIADLSRLNDMLKRHQIETAHVATSLLCPVCCLMPVDPVITMCCGATQCSRCANPSRSLLNGNGTGNDDQPIMGRTQCAHCGEERRSGDVTANTQRANEVARWAKEVSVLYRDELSGQSDAILPSTSSGSSFMLPAPDAALWGSPSDSVFGSPLLPQHHMTESVFASAQSAGSGQSLLLPPPGMLLGGRDVTTTAGRVLNHGLFPDVVPSQGFY